MRHLIYEIKNKSNLLKIRDFIENELGRIIKKASYLISVDQNLQPPNVDIREKKVLKIRLQKNTTKIFQKLHFVQLVASNL